MTFRGFSNALAGAAALLGVTSAVAAEKIDIPNADITLHGALYRPQGAGPFPAVVALHDCSGLDRRPGITAERYERWADLLVAHGFVVVLPDSFGSRGVGAQCRQRPSKVQSSRERVTDASAARRWLQTLPFVQPEHISLLGWSSGGTTTLWTVRPNATPHDSVADFRSAVAFYPGCRRLRETAWSARVPTLILIGSADDPTKASMCQQMVAGARGRSAQVEIVVYPGADHEFDRANAPARSRLGLPHTTEPSGRGHRGTDLTARADALKRVPQWLAK